MIWIYFHICTEGISIQPSLYVQGKLHDCENFSSVLSHDTFNNNFRKPQEEGVNTTITFILVPVLSDLRYFEINPLLVTVCFPVEIEMEDIPESGSCSNLSSLSGEIYNHTINFPLEPLFFTHDITNVLTTICFGNITFVERRKSYSSNYHFPNSIGAPSVSPSSCSGIG